MTIKKGMPATGSESWSERDLQPQIIVTSGPTGNVEEANSGKRVGYPSNPAWKKIPSELIGRDSRESSSRNYHGSTIVNESALLESADNSSMTRYSGDRFRY